MTRDEEIGGAVVLRKIDTFDPTTGAPRSLHRGDRISREELLTWSRANRKALVEAGFIHVHLLEVTKKDRFVIRSGKDEFDVVEGQLLRDGLSRDEATRLANEVTL
jgi:hypothetical protein